MRKIKNIFFDYGRTVVKHPSDEAGIEIILSLGAASAEDAAVIRSAVFSPKLMSLFDVGAITMDEYKAKVLENLPKSLHGVALKAADYHISALPIMEGMEELLRELKARGYKLFITSNMDPYHAAQMKDTPAAKYFDGMIFSGDVKVGKPDAEFFRKACEKFGAKAEETLFIDDLADNVEGALRFGIKGLVFGGDPDSVRDFIKSF